MTNPVLIARLQREYDRAIRREENAGTERQAWRLAAESDRALRRLQAARDGRPLPVAAGPRNPRQIARDAFVALGALGRGIARALQAAAALRKAHAANAMRRAAAAVRRTLRGVIGAIAKLALSAVAERREMPAAPAALWAASPLGISGAFAARREA